MSFSDMQYDDGGYWIATGDWGNSFDSGVLVLTGAIGIKPTALQIELVNLLTELPPQFKDRLKQSAKQYLSRQLQENGLSKHRFDFEIQFHQAVVPPVDVAEANYFYLIGSSDADMDRGIAFLCKGADRFAIVNCDYAYERFDWNDVEYFERLMTYNNLARF